MYLRVLMYETIFTAISKLNNKNCFYIIHATFLQGQLQKHNLRKEGKRSKIKVYEKAL